MKGWQLMVLGMTITLSSIWGAAYVFSLSELNEVPAVATGILFVIIGVLATVAGLIKMTVNE